MYNKIYASILDNLVAVKILIERVVFKNSPAAWQNGNKGNIILVPGYLETWVTLRTIANGLNNYGYKIHVVKDIEPNVLPVKKCVETLKAYIRDNKIDNTILIAHSKGGIINRFLHTDESLHSVIKFSINIATPNKGSKLARLNIHNLKELYPNSGIFKELQSKEQYCDKIVNIYPKYDNYIIPNESLYLEGAENIQVDIVGHHRVLESQKTLDVIRNILIPD